MDPKAIAKLDPEALRGLVPTFLASYIADEPAAARARDRLAAAIAAATPPELERLAVFLATLGDEHKLYPADPLARRIARVWCADVVLEPRIDGIEHLLEAVRRGPTVIVCNHQSYVDTTVTDVVLTWSGHESTANRLVAVAGPKVYAELFRRFAASCLNTLPAPQSTRLEGTARLAWRQLAAQAKASLEGARECLADGHVLLIYPEGSRTRTGRMRPFLKAVHRYLAIEGLSVVPTVVLGSEQMFPIDATKVMPAEVTLRFGAPLRVSTPQDAADVLAASHSAVSALLPDRHKPDPAEPPLV